GDTGVYLRGTATQIQVGDLILIVGDERLNNTTSENWDVREVTKVVTDGANDVTWVGWSEPLGHTGVQPAQQHPKFYAMRQRGALFGYNAVNPLMLATDTITALKNAHLLNSSGSEWDFKEQATGAVIDLDAVYNKATSGGWIALIVPDASVSRSPAG